MKLLIFGPPGSGKGTYASRLAPKLGITKIVTSEEIKKAANENKEIGPKVMSYINRGELVPDEIAIEIIKKRLNQADAKKGFILDGFPRSVEQAKAIEKITKVDAIINLTLPEKIMIEKISARRICKNCGDIYNIADINETIDDVDYILPPMNPKKSGICDKCGGEIIQRDDDKPETVKERLKVYEKQSKPVIKFFKGKIKFLDVIVNRGPEIMVDRIADDIKKMGLK